MYEQEDRHWWFVGRRRLALALIDNFVSPEAEARILDVGCGTGANIIALSGYGRAIGVDLSPIAINLARQRPVSRFAQASGVHLPFADGTFSLITVFDVLYHQWVTSDEQTLAELYRLLRPGGWLLVTDSALPALWSSHDDLYYARQRYTLNDIRGKISQAGFDPRFCSYANFILLPIIFLVRVVSDRRSLGKDRVSGQKNMPDWLNRGLIGIRQLEAAWLGSGRHLPLGSSVVCLCQKPSSGA